MITAANAGSQSFNAGGLGGGASGSGSLIKNVLWNLFTVFWIANLAANAAAQSFNAGGPGGNLGASAANAGAQSFNAGGPGGASGSAANAASQTFSGGPGGFSGSCKLT